MAIKLLTLQKGSRLDVHAQARAVLENEVGAVNPIMICGPLRTGKSYVMNALSETSSFGVSGQPRGFTQGVDVFPQLLPGPHFGNPSDAPKVALLDLEGHGEKGVAQDVKITTPPLLIAKVVLFKQVCPHGPSPEGILEAVQVMMLAAKFVSNRKSRRGLFGHLHILLRDCSQDEEECRRIIFDDESRCDAETDEHADAITRRNNIRKDIESYFEGTPRVWCLPKLPETSAPLDYRHASEPAYVAKIQELRNVVGTQLAQPKFVDGKKLTGDVVAEYLGEVVDAMRGDNTTPELNPPALMERVMNTMASRISKEFAELADKRLLALTSELPLADKQLSARVAEVRADLQAQLSRRLSTSGIENGSVGGRMEFREALDAKVETRETELRLQNERLVSARRRGQVRQAIFVCASALVAALMSSAPALYDVAASVAEQQLLAWFCKDHRSGGPLADSLCGRVPAVAGTDDVVTHAAVGEVVANLTVASNSSDVVTVGMDGMLWNESSPSEDSTDVAPEQLESSHGDALQRHSETCPSDGTCRSGQTHLGTSTADGVSTGSQEQLEDIASETTGENNPDSEPTPTGTWLASIGVGAILVTLRCSRGR